MNTREPTVRGQRIVAVQETVAELKNSADQARQESSEQVKARIARIKTDVAARLQQARDEAAQASDRTRSQWQQFRADAAARMRGFQDSSRCSAASPTSFLPSS